MTRVRSSGDSGAVAIVVAISAVLIFSLAALAVDLGNAYARKRDIQTEADLAALAAGSELPYDANASVIAGKANTFAAANETVGQDTSAWDFTDGDVANGFVELSADNPNQLRLITPPATVDFGLAGIMGFSSTDVRAEATVEIRSPGQAAPFYVAESCSTGQQTLIDTSNGHNTPSLDPPSSGGLGVGLTSITPATTSVGADPGLVTIKGTSLSGVKAVGFTTDGGVYPHVTIPAGSLSIADDGKSISFSLPNSVYDSQFYWYVRVAKLDSGGTLKWSSLSSALGFTVGTPYFICDGSISGNFGLLKLSREDSNSSDWDNRNIVYGIQRGLASWPHPDNVPDDCDGFSDAVEDPNKRQPFSELINCLATDPGLPANAASEGLIGKGGVNGRLARFETTEGCDPSGGSDELSLTDFDGNNDYTINNDVLSCFFADTTTTVEDVTRTDSPVEDAITGAIFDSPRFLWVPVLKVDPSQGHSGRYAITRFQPVFLTGQPMTATRQNPGGILNNGMSFSNSGLGEMKAVMINPDSLPESAVPGRMGTIEYVGAGTKVMTLID